MVTRKKQGTGDKQFWVKKRAQVIALRRKKCTFRDIAQTLNISVGCTVNACKRKPESNRLTDRRRSGRPRRTTAREDRYIERLALQNRRLTARQIAAEVSKLLLTIFFF